MICSVNISNSLEEVAASAEKILMPEYIKSFWDTLPEKALNLGIRILLALLFWFVGVQIIKLIRKIVKKSMERASIELGAIQFVDSFLKAGMYVLLAFMLASYFGVDAASIVALVGSAGVAIGLAIQGSLSNLAGGVLLMILKPFKVGDYIIEGVSGKEGTVSEVKIFYTKLITFDNKVIVLPNGNLANSTLVNVTSMQCRRLDINIGISYSSDIKKAKQALQKVLEDDPNVLHDKEKIVVVDALGESAINLIVRCWLNNDDYWNGKWRITENCKYALDEAGINVPFPQIDVHLTNE